jgi:putative flippase GtrA
MRMSVLDRAPAGLTGQGLRFAMVGTLATLTQLGLYYFLSGSVGSQLANVVSWLVSTLVANAAHQRYTFGVSHRGGGRGSVRNSGESDQVVGLLTSLAGLGVSSVVLGLLAEPTGVWGTVALVAVNATVGGLRFLVLRWWFTDRRAPGVGRGRAIVHAVRSAAVRSIAVSSPPLISTARTSEPAASSTQ